MSKKAWLQTCPTLPETNIFAPPQKMDGWNTIVNFLLGCHIFQGLFAVSCGELYSLFVWHPDSSFDASIHRWFFWWKTLQLEVGVPSCLWSLPAAQTRSPLA